RSCVQSAYTKRKPKLIALVFLFFRSLNIQQINFIPLLYFPLFIIVVFFSCLNRFFFLKYCLHSLLLSPSSFQSHTLQTYSSIQNEGLLAIFLFSLHSIDI